MRRLFFTFILALFALPASAQTCLLGSQTVVYPWAHETITVSTVAKTLTVATYAPTGAQGSILAVITTATDTARWWDDGTAPTSTVGHSIAAGGTLTLCGTQAISKFQIIRSGSADVPISVTYFRQQ